MPGLYGYSAGNTTVSVGNTIGLYQQPTGNISIFNSAQTFFNLLANSASIGFEIINGNTNVTAVTLPTGVTAGTYGGAINIPVITVGADGRIINLSTVIGTGTYGNSNVAAYLASNTDPTISNLNANAAVQAVQINTINANVGAFETYSNIFFGNLTSNIATINSNIGAFETYTNIFLGNLQANVYSNANVASYLPVYSGNIGQLGAGNAPVVIGYQAGLIAPSSDYQRVTIGPFAGQISQGPYTTAVGTGAGANYQGPGSTAIGYGAGGNSQGPYATAIGIDAGQQNQSAQAVALGLYAGGFSQGNNAVALGTYAGQYNQGNNSIAIGYSAGYAGQANNTIILNANGNNLFGNTASALYINPIRNVFTNNTQALFYNLSTREVSYVSLANVLSTYSGNISANVITANTLTANAVTYPNGQPISGTYSNVNVAAYLGSLTNVAIGQNAGLGSANNAVALGVSAGSMNQGDRAIAIGSAAGYTTQNERAIAIGFQAGSAFQSANAIAIGSYAGYGQQGYGAIAIGMGDNATTDQPANSIWLNASNTAIKATDATNAGFYVSPVRNDSGNVAQAMYYNTSTYEITYATATGGTYSNANVAAYLPVFGGNILAGNINIPYTSGTRNRGQLAIGGNVSQYDTGVIASFIGNEPTYLYTSLQNSNSGNTAYSSYAINDDTHTYYGELGINSSTYDYAAAGYPNNAFSKPYATFLQSTGANLAIGTYSNHGINFVVNGGTVAADAMTIANNGNVTVVGNLTVGALTTTGNITANMFVGTATLWSGNLGGNVIYDGTNFRSNIQAWPINNPNNSFLNGGLYYQQFSNRPVYLNGVLQTKSTNYNASGSLITTQATTANLLIQNQASVATGNTVSAIGTNTLMQVWPANVVYTNNDRQRTSITTLEMYLGDAYWGANGVSATTALTPVSMSQQSICNIEGTGYAAHVIGINGQIDIRPMPATGKFANIQYATANFGQVQFGTQYGTTAQANVAYARAFAAGMSNGNAGNLLIQNGIGLHTVTGWAVANNKYVILNEDSPSIIQTNGNIRMVSTATTGFNSAGVFTVAALNATTGVVGQFAAVSNGTAKNGGQMAYWDTTNNRWSWFDTNLAVS